MEAVGLENDTRGWIMCIVSGIACVGGAGVIYLDVLLQHFPKTKDFQIQESNTFLACSFAFSFGVMIFTALYSMLPESMDYFIKGGVSKNAAGFIMMACYLGGFAGIQMISRLLHRFIPSHVVDCDHTHDEPLEAEEHDDLDGHKHYRSRSRRSTNRKRSGLSAFEQQAPSTPPMQEANIDRVVTEASPLLPANGQPQRPSLLSGQLTSHSDYVAAGNPMASPSKGTRSRATTRGRRPSILDVRNRVVSFVKDTKTNCDEYGPCYGYSDPCGQECFKHISTRSHTHPRSDTLRTNTMSFPSHQITDVAEHDDGSVHSPTYNSSRTHSRDPADSGRDDDQTTYNTHSTTHEDDIMMDEDLEAQHHHHVPTKPFLSIGLQTVIAITLHKLPEGFITYSTNHANPSLGFNVFMALFVHNIVEGFTMALPLFMALDSRLKAMAWTSLLGGLSQPLGAGIAVLIFKITKRSDITINEVTYACLFAVTAGIMTSVALQLFVESLSINHNRNMSIVCAFLGMLLLGLTSALVAH